MNFKWHSYTIEQDFIGNPEGGKWEVFGHGEYPEDSVLAGQYCRGFLDSFDTLEEAKRAYPQADVLKGETSRIPSGWLPEISHTPPSWFDPADAGERWDDDY